MPEVWSKVEGFEFEGELYMSRKSYAKHLRRMRDVVITDREYKLLTNLIKDLETYDIDECNPPKKVVLEG